VVTLKARKRSRLRIEDSLIDQPTQVNWIETTPDERTMATLAHALQLIGSWIAPLIIFLIRRHSRFVSFHALQALLLQIIHTIIVVVLMVLWFTTIFATVFHQTSGRPPEFPAAMLLLFPLVWLGFMAMWLGTLIIAILYAIKAGRGEWADYPVIGKLARKILKMDPMEGRLAPTPQM
jgi:uncharacterized membrane protein